MFFAQFIQFFINGLMGGAIYALIAIGIVSIYKATKVVNFAHGYIIMFGAYFYYTFSVIIPGIEWMPDWLLSWEPMWLVEWSENLPMLSLLSSVAEWVKNLPRIMLGIIGALICNSILGLLIERFLMRPLMGQSAFAMIMVTDG